MSQLALARLLIGLALTILIPAGCSDSWFASPSNDFDVELGRYVTSIETSGIGGFAIEHERLAAFASTSSALATVAIVAMALAAVATSFGGHGTNRSARFGVIGLSGPLIVATMYTISRLPPPWSVQGPWPSLFITSVVLLAMGVALLPPGGRDLVVPDAEPVAPLA